MCPAVPEGLGIPLYLKKGHGVHPPVERLGDDLQAPLAWDSSSCERGLSVNGSNPDSGPGTAGGVPLSEPLISSGDVSRVLTAYPPILPCSLLLQTSAFPSVFAILEAGPCWRLLQPRQLQITASAWLLIGRGTSRPVCARPARPVLWARFWAGVSCTRPEPLKCCGVGVSPPARSLFCQEWTSRPAHWPPRLACSVPQSSHLPMSPSPSLPIPPSALGLPIPAVQLRRRGPLTLQASGRHWLSSHTVPFAGSLNPGPQRCFPVSRLSLRRAAPGLPLTLCSEPAPPAASDGCRPSCCIA